MWHTWHVSGAVVVFSFSLLLLLFPAPLTPDFFWAMLAHPGNFRESFCVAEDASLYCFGEHFSGPNWFTRLKRNVAILSVADADGNSFPAKKPEAARHSPMLMK